MEYQFSLNFNNEKQELTPDAGLAFGQLASLMKCLDCAINAKDGKECVLNKIDNHGYTPHFRTDSQSTYNNFIELHNNIYEKGINDLAYAEKIYAEAIRHILSGSKYLEPLDNESKALFRITSAEIEKGVETFNSITSLTGIISEIGSQKLNDISHIYVNGITYKIYITPQQDEQLRQYYKETVLDLKIKQKKAVKSGKVISARLISIRAKSNAGFMESMSKLTDNDLSFLSDITNHEDIISLIRS